LLRLSSEGFHPMKCVRFAIAATLFAVSAAPARGQGFITPFLGFSYGGDVAATCASLTECEEKRANWGVGFGATSGILGFEEEIGYAKHFFGKTDGEDNALLTVMSNLMAVVPAGPIRPYALFGIGLMRPHVKFDASSLALDKNALGYNIGGGVNIFFSPAVGIRGDVRHMQTFKDMTLGGFFSNDKLDFWRGSAGLTFRF
jgi:opacity protein-like surface antigen